MIAYLLISEQFLFIWFLCQWFSRIAIPQNIKGVATIFIASPLDIISGIYQSVVSTNLLHLGEMHRSVAKQTTPHPSLCISERCDQKRFYIKWNCYSM